MTRGAAPLTLKQKEIILDNREKFASAIAVLPSMEGCTPRQINMFQKRIDGNKELVLADMLEAYVAENGVPKEFGAVVRYIRYLRENA